MLYNFDDQDVKNDEGILSDQPFTPDQSNLDSRLDWTVGRRGIYYWDFGIHPGFAWIRDQAYGGPYSPKKHVYAKKDENTLTSSSNPRITAKNFSIIRFDDVLLMAAEAEIEAGDLEVAKGYVNRVRERAANPVSWVKSNISTGDPANAHYVVGTWKDPWTDKQRARDAVRFERRLEFAMEEYRFYDLVRWGIADQVLNKYISKEKLHRTYLNTAVFQKGRNEYFPVPIRIMDLAEKNGSKLTQTKGY
jgi:starch-binding outer membrane protein, SusD/RagB family